MDLNEFEIIKFDYIFLFLGGILFLRLYIIILILIIYIYLYWFSN